MEGPWDGLPIEGTRSIASPHQCVLSRYNCPPLDPLLFVDRKKNFRLILIERSSFG